MTESTEPSSIDPAFRELVAAYLDDTITSSQLADLEARLRTDLAARAYFLRFARHDRELRMEVHTRRQAERVLSRISVEESETDERTTREIALRWKPSPFRPLRWFAAAASIALAAGIGWMAANRYATRAPVGGVPQVATGLPTTSPAVVPDIAWLVNAQNCQWANGVAPADMRPGTLLDISRGLAEVRFRSGAVLLMEGPARLELVSENAARLHRGRITGNVAGPIKGFEIFSPTGKIIDLGTEFGVSVADSGQTDVVVFNGKVQAVGLAGGSGVIDLAQAQTVRIDSNGVASRDSSTDVSAFVRRIVPPPVIEPRSLYLNFAKAYMGTIADAEGLGTGLTHRLPGTGTQLPEADPNLLMNTETGVLELTTTNSDINNQRGLPTGEYLGVRLADLGFTGPEDFEVEMVMPNIPALQRVGQFGLYAGGRSDRVIRGGLISRDDNQTYTLFMTNNNGGKDRDSHFVGLFSMGDDVRFRLKRTNGKYALTVENMATGSESALATRHPQFMDDENDLYVGFFGANTGGGQRRTLQVKELSVTVWTRAGERRTQMVALGNR